MDKNNKQAKEKNLNNNLSEIYSIIAIVITIIYAVGFGIYFYFAFMEFDNLSKEIKAQNMLQQEISREIQSIQYNIDNLYYIDLESDDSITKFINSDVSFNDKSYIPESLELLAGTTVIDLKGGSQLMVTEAKNALLEMGSSFYLNFKEDIKVLSAYRSYEYQQGIKASGCPDNLCSKPGFSEHQSGLAVDLWEASTNTDFLSNKKYNNYYEWLKENAHNYGFHNTYQKGLEIDGYDIEPWHWRYLGNDLATYLKDNDLTLAEFYKDR